MKNATGMPASLSADSASAWETPVACLPSEMPVMMTKSGLRAMMLSRLSEVDLPTPETLEESTA